MTTRKGIAIKLRYEVIPQLDKHRRSHQSWLDHFRADPTYSCSRCTPELIASVGNATEQEITIAVYDKLIETCNAAAQLLLEELAEEL